MTNYARGRAKEYAVIKELEKEGYYCIRSAGSHKCADIVCFLQKDNEELPLIKFIQVKSGNSPYKKDMFKLHKLKLPAIIQKQLWIIKPYQEIRKIIIP